MPFSIKEISSCCAKFKNIKIFLVYAYSTLSFRFRGLQLKGVLVVDFEDRSEGPWLGNQVTQSPLFGFLGGFNVAS